jgi:hypothetical protein
VLDVIMLAVTEDATNRLEYKDLLSGAGFKLERIVATHSQYSIIEAIVI